MKKLLAGFAAILFAGAAHAAPIQWTTGPGANGHYYEFINVLQDYGTAKANAEASTFAGLQGHLATITSAEENAFVYSLVPSGQWAWLGGERIGSTNSFEWTAGPEAGTTFFDEGPVSGVYSNFFPGEPNGQISGENAVHIWGGATWNDLGTSAAIFAVVEYSDPVAGGGVAPVPLPAGLPLLVAGLGVFGVLRRRQK